MGVEADFAPAGVDFKKVLSRSKSGLGQYAILAKQLDRFDGHIFVRLTLTDLKGHPLRYQDVVISDVNSVM